MDISSRGAPPPSFSPTLVSFRVESREEMAALKHIFEKAAGMSGLAGEIAREALFHFTPV